MKKLFVIIDNGHGESTPGKCSPDKELQEWSWTRDLAERLQKELRNVNIDSHRIVPETTDISLSERVHRANNIARKAMDRGEVPVLISIHLNAAGNSNRWCNAQGFCSYIAPKAGEYSKVLANIFCDYASYLGLAGNRSIPSNHYWIGDFSILKNTICPAIITENMFMDNVVDKAFLMSEDGRKLITVLHVSALQRFLQYIQKTNENAT